MEIARTTAHQLAGALRLCPCTASPVAVTPCLHCQLKADHAAILRVIAEVEVGDSLDSDVPPLFAD